VGETAHDRLRRWLTSPRWPLLAALVAVTLSLPALGFGWFADDWLHRAKLLGDPTVPRTGPPATDLFVFFPGEGSGNARLHETAFLPWWAAEDIRASFFRPLTTVTHQLDYALWPDSAPLMHAHSLLWLALAVWVVALLYRRLASTSLAAGVGALLFAMEDAHAGAVGWIANRNALIALVLSVTALALHDRWRRHDGGAPAAVAAALCFGLALLAGEAALAITPYLLAYALILDRGEPRWARLGALSPYALLSAAWLLYYSLSPYGTSGSDTYVDPASLGFVRALVERVPVLLLAQWTPVPSDLWIVTPGPVRIGWAVAGAAVVGGLLLIFRPMLRELAEARFWALGMILCLAPVCAAFPMNRLLVFCGLGAFGLLGAAASWSGWPGPRKRGGRLLRGVVVALLVVHVGFGVVLKPLALVAFRTTMGAFTTAAAEAPAEPAVADQTLVFVNGMAFLISYVTLVRRLEGGTVPAHADWLAHLQDDLSITRTDDRTLSMRSTGGFLSGVTQQLLRSPSLPFERGQSFRRQGWTVTVEEVTPAGMPARVVVRFDEPLEDPSLRWLVYVDQQLESFVLPAVGETVTVAPSLPPMPLPPWGPYVRQ